VGTSIGQVVGGAKVSAGLALALAAVLLLAPARARAAIVLAPVTTTAGPVYVTHAGDQRLFIVEQGGRIRIFDRAAGVLLVTPFLDIQAKISTGGERGLFSVAFHPDYASNGFFYVDYTNVNGDTVIERYHVNAGTPNAADPASATILLTIAQPFPNHNGGQLQIGRNDGFLYIGMGDGGSEGDPSCFSQRNDSLLGKMLRLDVRQNLNRAPFYGIPADNPFTAANDPGGLIPDEVWAFGLRNPWRFSFDRATGDLFIGDVGQNSFEEVDLHRAASPGGQNYGWKVMEGLTCFSTAACPAGTPACNAPQLTLPIHTYPHGTGDCSITGGYVYRGTLARELAGRYVFADYCSGAVRTLQQTSPGVWQAQPLLAAGTSGVTSFGEDADGELYITVGNDVRKLVAVTPPLVPAAHRWAKGTLALALLAVGSLRLALRPRRPI
jgi:glucose/arabinose dehydrogenase